MNFGKILKELREERELSQVKLAREINYSNSIISKWEANLREPTASAIMALAVFFGVTVDYLLGLEDYEPTQNTNASTQTCQQDIVQVYSQLKPLSQQMLIAYAARLLQEEHNH